MSVTLGTLVASALLANSVTAQVLYSDQIGNIVALSEESTHPFRNRGRGVHEEPVKSRYGKAVRKHPSVRSCLEESEQNTSTPDLKKFAWGEFKGTAHVTVCMFRIATSYESIEDFRDWLHHQGFSVVDLGSVSANGERRFNATKSVPHYSELCCSSLLADLLVTRSRSGRSDGAGLAVDVDENGEMTFIQFNLSSK